MIFKLISPSGVPMNPVLFPMMRETFLHEGHNFTDNIKYCDVILFDLHTRIADYDQKEIDEVVESGKPVATFDEFDKGGLSDLVWPNPLTDQQRLVFQYLTGRGIPAVHFCRLIDKTKEKYSNLYPYEKPILFEQPLVSPDELFNRPYDIVFIANSAPQREHLKGVLGLNAKLKCKIVLGEKKIPFDDWINEHRKGKLFISWSAGGYSDERMQALFSVAGIIRENNDQLLPHDFKHLETAIRLSPIPTKEDLDTLVEIVNDKERLYSIYKSGYEFMKEHYSKEAISKYFLDKIIKHCA